MNINTSSTHFNNQNDIDITAMPIAKKQKIESTNATHEISKTPMKILSNHSDEIDQITNFFHNLKVTSLNKNITQEELITNFFAQLQISSPNGINVVISKNMPTLDSYNNYPQDPITTLISKINKEKIPLKDCLLDFFYNSTSWESVFELFGNHAKQLTYLNFKGQNLGNNQKMGSKMGSGLTDRQLISRKWGQNGVRLDRSTAYLKKMENGVRLDRSTAYLK